MDSEVSTFLYLCESTFEKSPCKNWAYYLYNKKRKKCIHVNYFQMTEYHLESSYHRFNSSNHVCSINSSLKINTIEEKSGPKIKI